MRTLPGVDESASAAHPERLILVVQEDALTRDTIAKSLERHDFRTIEAGSGEQALALLEDLDIRLVVLDILLPGMDGFEVCARLRAGTRNTPVIMLTTLGDMEYRLRGLGSGADDYMVKPFHPEELAARVQAVLRRSKEPDHPGTELVVGNMRVDLHARKCVRNGQEVDLTPKEFLLLAELCSNRGKALSRADLADRIWGRDHHGSDKSLDVYVGRLRHKVEDRPEDPSLILTVRGFGYVCS